MARQTLAPALFFDFDNTLTQGDVLDEVIERYSPNETWRDWENAWEDGRLSAEDCLRLQVENLRIGREELFRHLLDVRVDPAFSALLAWARPLQVPVHIVSDSFVPLIRHILANNGIRDVPIFANDLRFAGDRLLPSFPFADPSCRRSANAKARHLLPFRQHCIVFAGDGRSDLDAAMAADVVFAKSTLARELDARRLDYLHFESLAPVLDYVRAQHARLRSSQLRAV